MKFMSMIFSKSIEFYIRSNARYKAHENSTWLLTIKGNKNEYNMI